MIFFCIFIKILYMFITEDPIGDTSALVQVIAWSDRWQTVTWISGDIIVRNILSSGCNELLTKT